MENGDRVSRRLVLGVAVAGVLVLGLVTAAVVGILQFGRSTDADGTTCVDRAGKACTNLSIADIEEVAALTLPDGTTIVSSRYDSFQDWHMEAVVDLPKGATSPLDDPEVAAKYDGAAHDGIFRSAETTTTADGRLRLNLTAFTT